MVKKLGEDIITSMEDSGYLLIQTGAGARPISFENAKRNILRDIQLVKEGKQIQEFAKEGREFYVEQTAYKRYRY